MNAIFVRIHQTAALYQYTNGTRNAQAIKRLTCAQNPTERLVSLLHKAKRY